MRWLFLLSLILFVTSCSAQSTPSPPSGVPSVPPTQTIAPASPTPSGTATPDPRADAVKKYIDDSFGFPGQEPTWYRDIKGIAVHNNLAVGYVDTNDGQVITGVCRALSGYVFANGNTSGLTGVMVSAPDGTSVTRAQISDSCTPP